jgi:hypothetical protein
MTAGLSKQVRCIKYICLYSRDTGSRRAVECAKANTLASKQIVMLLAWGGTIVSSARKSRKKAWKWLLRRGGSSGRWRVIAAAVRMVAPWGQMAMAELPWRPGCWVLWIEESPVGKMNKTGVRILKHLLEAEKSTFRIELSFQRSESTTGLLQATVFVQRFFL